jgi:hypothetical protein
MYVTLLPNKLTYKLHKLNELPEDGQELRLKHVRAIINKNIVQQVGIIYYIGSVVARRMYSIQFLKNSYTLHYSTACAIIQNIQKQQKEISYIHVPLNLNHTQYHNLYCIHYHMVEQVLEITTHSFLTPGEHNVRTVLVNN